MWKKACVCAILTAVLPQGITWAAYGDVISNVPTPPAVTETAKTAAAASVVTAKPAPQVPAPATPKPGLVPETKPAVIPVPKATAPAPKVTVSVPKEPASAITARVPVKPALPAVTDKTAAEKTPWAPKTRRETKKPATKYKVVYEVGDSGWKVREAQRKLRLLGYEVENQQGHFTKEMSRQLQKFQRHAKLKADGKLDEKTYEALGWGVFDKTGIQKIQARDILSTAARYKGVPYYFGGTTPRGFDCSGYVQYVFRQRGAQLTRTADAQFLEGMSLRRSQLKPGDLVFFSTYEAGASHVGIYAGNGQFWNATSSRGVMLCRLNDSYWGPHYYGARRVLATNGAVTAK